MIECEHGYPAGGQGCLDCDAPTGGPILILALMVVAAIAGGVVWLLT